MLGKTTWRIVPPLAKPIFAGILLAGLACLAVIGCVSTRAPLAQPRRTAPAPREMARTTPAPDLRIPDAPLPQGPGRPAESKGEIPLVPLPPLRPDQPEKGAAPGGLPLPPVPPPPSEGTQPPPSPSPAPGKGERTARDVYQSARASYARLDSYIARFTRREVVNGKAQPEEVMLFRFRRDPFSIYMKWLGKEGAGREVTYVKGHYGNKIHTLLAAGDIPLVPAGKRMALSPDNPLVRAASRHSITDAGIGACLDHLGAALRAQETGPAGANTIKLREGVRRPEYVEPVAAFEITIPPGVEAPLPRGGNRLICFDPETHLPQLILTWDERGQEVEYYRYDRLLAPARLDSDDFDPDKLWARPAGARLPS